MTQPRDETQPHIHRAKSEERAAVVGAQLYPRRKFLLVSQVLSATAQRAAAAEILNRVREEVATRNAMHARGA